MYTTAVIGEIVGMIAGLFVVNSIPSWHLSFITDSYLSYLPYANIAIVATGIVKVCMYLSPWYRVQKFFEALSHLISIAILSLFISLRPFDFAPINRLEINAVISFGCTLAIVTLFVIFLVTVFRIVKGSD